MPDRWEEIHGPEGPRAQGFSGQRRTRHDTPYVRRPTCAEHCTGLHTRDSVLQCPRCQGVAYEIWVHEWVFTPGHYFNELRPMGSALPVEPGATPRCVDCGVGLQRRWK